jgi:hypothetical protein
VCSSDLVLEYDEVLKAPAVKIIGSCSNRR